jgi:hypothetical protein
MAVRRVGALLAILAVFGVALAVAGPGGGTVAGGGMALGGERLDSDVAARVSAQDPARTLPALDLSALEPGLSPALRRGSAALAEAGIDPKRDLLAPFSFVVISLERSCPPPALLACRPAIRFAGRLRSEPPPDLQSDLEAALVAGLRAAGFRRLVVRGSQGGDFAGRVSSGGEMLAKWRLVDDVLVVVTGGLALEPQASAAPARDASADSSEPVVEVNPSVLAMLVASPP